MIGLSGITPPTQLALADIISRLGKIYSNHGERGLSNLVSDHGCAEMSHLGPHQEKAARNGGFLVEITPPRASCLFWSRDATKLARLVHPIYGGGTEFAVQAQIKPLNKWLK